MSHPLDSDQVTLLLCPDCNLMMSRYRIIEMNESWSEWRCWDCGHRFGGFMDGGTLDLGLNHWSAAAPFQEGDPT